MAAAAAAAAALATADAGEFGETVAEQVSREVFAVYQCHSAAGQHGIEHPGDIAEPSSLAAIPLPPSDYPLWETLGDVAAAGKLSCLQLEASAREGGGHVRLGKGGSHSGGFQLAKF